MGRQSLMQTAVKFSSVFLITINTGTLGFSDLSATFAALLLGAEAQHGTFAITFKSISTFVDVYKPSSYFR